MAYPQVVSKNQFGETIIGYELGGGGYIDCSFIVDSANGNGLGIRSLKNYGQNALVKNVFMHTSSTPAGGNPNPASGYIVVQLAQNFLGYQGGYIGFVSPTSGSNLLVASAGLTVGQLYIITVLGTTSVAQWNVLGVPAGAVPAVGVAFIAAATSCTGTGAVQLPAAAGSTINHIEAVGDSNLSVNPTDSSGSLIYLQVLGATNSSTTTLVATAPADNTVIGMRFVMQGTTGATI